MRISSGARNRRMKLFKPYITLGTALMIGIFLLLPADTAHAQESLQTDMTIESTTIIPQTGEVIVSGTLSCSEPSTVVLNHVSVEVRQPIGRLMSIQGFLEGTNFQCDENGTPYTLSVFAFPGSFKPGTAVIDAFYQACPETGLCGQTIISPRAVRLQP